MYTTSHQNEEIYLEEINKQAQELTSRNQENKTLETFHLGATLRLDRFNFFETSSVYNDENSDKGQVLGSLTEQIWTYRSLKNRILWNKIIHEKEAKLLKSASMWLFYSGDSYGEVIFTGASIKISLIHPPVVRFSITYHSSYSIIELEKMIGEIFDYWANAGDEAYVLCDLDWKN